MRIDRISMFRCEVCNRSFIDFRMALDHESGCRREVFRHDENIRKAMYKNARVDHVDDFRPSRIIRGYGSPAYGIFDIPCDSIESAIRQAVGLAENRSDFEENFTVVRWLEGRARDFEPVPAEQVDVFKRGAWA